MVARREVGRGHGPEIDTAGDGLFVWTRDARANGTLD
jgi:hypothetical protein